MQPQMCPSWAVQADVEGWEADDREKWSWADSQVAPEIPPEFVRAFCAWYRQFARVCLARERMRLSSVVPDLPSLRRIYEGEQSSGEIHQGRVPNLRHRISVPSRLHRSQKRQLRSMYKNYDEQDWSYLGLVPAYACISDSLWASSEPLTGSLPSDLVQLCNLTLPPEINVLFSDCSAECQADPYWSGVSAAVRQDDPAVRPPAALERFRLHKRRMRFRGKYAVPASLIQQVILACHWYVHSGIERTLLMVDRKFCFHGLTKADLEERVKQVCDSCAVCQQTKRHTGKQPGSVDHFPIPPDIFSSLSIDFVDLPLTEHNTVKYDYCMVVVCRLSGYVMAILTTKCWLDSRKAAELFLEHVVFFMGLPARIFADNQSVITSNFTTQLCLLSGIEQHQSVISYPSSNGRAEATVKSVVMASRKFLHQRAGKWVQALPLAVWGLNNLPGLIAPYSPHRLVFGTDAVRFGDVPPFVPEDAAEDALGFFQRVAA